MSFSRNNFVLVATSTLADIPSVYGPFDSMEEGFELAEAKAKVSLVELRRADENWEISYNDGDHYISIEDGGGDAVEFTVVKFSKLDDLP